MENKKCASVLFASGRGLAGVFSLQGDKARAWVWASVEAEQQQDMVEQVRNRLAAGKLSFEESTAVVDCRDYTQYRLHSELTDQKQIARTIAFDAEEAVAADVSNMAISFAVRKTDESGSEITIFTSDLSDMSQKLEALQKSRFDPTVIEPDAICLARFIRHFFPEAASENRLVVIVTPYSCFLMHYAENEKIAVIRNFLSEGTDAGELLARQIPILSATIEGGDSIDTVMLADDTGSLNENTLAEQTGMNVKKIDISGAFTEALPEDIVPSKAAAVCGNALAELSNTTTADFRRSFSPYMGRQKIIEKIYMAVSIAATVLLVAGAIFFQTAALKQKGYADKLEKKMEKQYSEVMYGREHKSAEPIDRRLERVYNQLERLKKGLFAGDDESVSAKLTFVIQAINSAPDSVDLNLEEISITTKTMRLRGDTASKSQTLTLFRQFDANPQLTRANETLKQVSNRDTFSVNLEPAGDTGRAARSRR